MKKLTQLLLILCSFSLLQGGAQAQDFSGLQANGGQSNNNSNTTATSATTAANDTNTPSQEAKARAVIPSSMEPRPAFKLLAGELNSRYTLGPADVIMITVMRHPEVSGLYPINTEGKIQYEFVGDIVLAGMTKDEAAQLLVKKLQTYIINPEVTIKITEYNSKVVYVIGEVGAPGKIYMRGDTITVRDALLAANLPQLTAATDACTLFTPSAVSKVVPKKVNVYALLYEGDLKQNYTMKPGDTIYMPPTLWAKIARFLNPITQPLGSATGSAAAVAAL
jgi:polysaccharide export outer membrane protein